jgi:hypothetical protein
MPDLRRSSIGLPISIASVTANRIFRVVILSRRGFRSVYFSTIRLANKEQKRQPA